MGGDGGLEARPNTLAAWFPLYEVGLALAAATFILLAPDVSGSTVEALAATAFLSLLAVWLGFFVVRLDRGHLRLTMIASQAAAMTLPVPFAAVVGLTSGLSWVRHGPRGYRYSGIGGAVFWTAGGALLRAEIGSGSQLRFILGYVAAASFLTLANWAVNLITFRMLNGYPIGNTIRTAFDRDFVAAFAYFALAGLLIANMLDGTVGGYILAGVVALLSITLTETIDERRRRAALEAQVADSQRHVGYSRAMEGVAHSLRHQLAITKGYLEDLLELRLAPHPKERALSAKSSADVALQMLDRLAAGASPKLHLSAEPVIIQDIAAGAVELVRGKADGQGTRLAVTARRRPLRISGDPLLLRDVVTELCLNALDAVGKGGRVTVSVGKRRGGWAAVSVADSGPGVNDSERERLFEPHFTTKTEGTGMGLFTAFAVVHEHGGKLVYEGGPKGAVFTVLIPTVPGSVQAVEAVAVAGDGLNPAIVSQRLAR